MKYFRVKVAVKTLEIYRVEAENKEEALESWADGTLLDTDDSTLESEILKIEEIGGETPALLPKGAGIRTHEPTNSDRAQWAKDTLAVFTAITFGGRHPDSMERDDLECAISDLICDLLHYARQQEFDAGSIMQHAAGHFGCELLEETLQP